MGLISLLIKCFCLTMDAFSTHTADCRNHLESRVSTSWLSLQTTRAQSARTLSQHWCSRCYYAGDCTLDSHEQSEFDRCQYDLVENLGRAIAKRTTIRISGNDVMSVADSRHLPLLQRPPYRNYYISFVFAFYISLTILPTK